ncbi:MAG: glycosyltransferase family 4 protein [Balneolales bacterium]
MAFKEILFIDPVSAKPYTVGSLYKEPMGGTEATVVRIAKALSKNHVITIAQASREAAMTDVHGIKYIPFTYNSTNSPVKDVDSVIVIRSNKVLPRVRSQYPYSRLYLWMHCFPGKHHKQLNKIALQTDTTIITVSDTHQKAVIDFIKKYQDHRSYDRKQAKVIRIYNPVDDELKPDGRPVDRNKLVYFSSPHKGLPQVLETFSYIRKSIPELCLYVANPGYMWMKSFPDMEGVINLGALSHGKVIRHVRDALCVFYPQSNFRETFGLVFAEANAVGTPVLAHDMGSTPEILGRNGQLVNAVYKDEVKAGVQNWRVNGRPKVTLHSDFRCSKIAQQWEKILTTPAINA